MTVMDKADQSVGTSTTRIEALDKVTGAARYAGEHPLAELAHGVVVTSTIGRGRITAVGADDILAMPGVLAVLHSGNSPRLNDPGDATLLLLQADTVPHHGAVVALVVASSLEQAQAGAEALLVTYDEEPHDVCFTADHAEMYVPDHVNPGFDTETVIGDVDAKSAAADVVVEATYTTPTQQNNAMEPHATTATWHDGGLTVYDSNQGAASVKQSLVKLFGLDKTQVRVLSEHVGGGFGSKGAARPTVVLAPMAALTTGRPVRVTLTRQQMFALVGYRTPTIQQVRLAADRDGTITAIDHLAYGQTSTVLEFAEQTAVISRMMYGTEALRSRHRLVALDVPTPRWMRAPGEAPGSFALESAVDELAEACGVDPVELRIRNDPAAEPESGLPFSSRNLVACLREGAQRFGWHDRDRRPGIRSDGRWLLGTGVAAATYPARTAPSTAAATAEPDGRFTVRVTASDIGTGARTALTLVAADALGVAPGQVTVLIGDSDFGQAMIAGGSMGTASWTWAVTDACRELLVELAGREIPADGITVTADTAAKIKAMSPLSRHSFGAQFAEVAVDVRTGEVRVRRMLGIFAAGRIVNPLTARSQLIGGMTMGLSAALLEEAIIDTASGDYVNHDLAGYHIAAHADVPDIEVGWVDEVDHEVNPAGVKGIGELGIVGAPAAIANAVWHATGVRQRDLPIRPDRVIGTHPRPNTS
ncbi:MAG: xanthine dehydrogenase family protein molybdopterin-binding subunit [Actinomycetota bacterium]|nr:xanthine dehydrogenase family protein molybdopterin-binding subunit [Actinomycetota bacterium]